MRRNGEYFKHLKRRQDNKMNLYNKYLLNSTQLDE